MQLNMFRLILVFCCLFCAFWAQGQLVYTGGVVKQDFDSLPRGDVFDLSDFGVAKGPAALTADPISALEALGWSAYARVGTQLLFMVGNGDVGTASVYSYGQLAARDRALGSLAGSHEASLGWRMINNTEQTLTQFTLSFYAEQWRNGGTSSLVGLTGEYRLTTTGDINSGTYTLVPALDAPALTNVAAGFALNGNAQSNRSERSATVTGLSWNPGQMLILRWRDVNESGADNGVALDEVVFHAPTVVAAPQIQELRPAAGAQMVLSSSPVVVVFDQPVTVTPGWYEITGSVSGPLAATVSNAGPLRYTLTPVAPWPSDETVTLRFVSTAITNAGGQPMAADWTSSFTPVAGTSFITRMGLVQGNDGYSPLTGSLVTVQGVVVADFQGSSPALGGFYLQEEDGDADADGESSEALWIGHSATAVTVGDVVQVTGTVAESGGLTQLTSVSNITLNGTAALPAITPVTLPVNSTVDLERYEGMRVSFAQTLSVTSNSGGTGTTDGFSRYGELLLCADGPLVSPTEFMDPNDFPASGLSSTGRGQVAAIHAYERLMTRRSLLLDDASSAQWPNPTPYLNAQSTRRCGDSVTGLTGILTYMNGAYRVQPTESVSFVDANPRPLVPPATPGRLKVAAMNVLNYFITFGGANDRGANNADEFARQKGKVISALAALDADVLGLIEIQNSSAAMADLLAALNAAVTVPYSFVPEPIAGYPAAGVAGDYIRCVLLYRPAKVTLYGPCHMDTDAVWSSPNPLRFPLAQIFEESATGERFLLCLNHWKSKSSSGATGLNTDQNDGQAGYTELRRQIAARIHVWLQEITAQMGDMDVLLMGDLNSNGEEDPLDILRVNGWADQGQRFHTDDYSYRLGGARGRLDHTFATATMATQVLAQDHWHINADEPAFYDYNTEDKSAAHLLINVGTPFRSSDHDPILVGLDLSPQPTTFAMWQAARVWAPGAGSAALDDPDGDGFQNLAEYALNMPPEVVSTAQMPVGSRVGNEFRFDYRSRIQLSGSQVIPEWSDDLLLWHDMMDISTLEILDACTELKRAIVPTAGKERIFVRLRITGP